MIDLVLTVICSTTIALILKHNDRQSGNILLLLSANYFVATLIGLLIWGSQSTRIFNWQPVLFGVILGGLFVFSFFAFAKAVAAAGTALATVSARLSVIIPVLCSILFFGENPHLKDWLGFLLTFVTLFFFYKSLASNSQKKLRLEDYLFILAVLVGIGINDFSMKIFNEWRPESELGLFLLSIFFSAFIYTIILVYLKKIKFSKPTIIRGAALGIPNIFSTFFLIGALKALPAIMVYPTVNISVIILTALAAAELWRETPNKPGIAALVSGSLAIVLLV